MANRRNGDKFFIFAPDKHGPYKGSRLLGVNRIRKNKREIITLQDLLVFLEEKGIQSEDVKLDDCFTTRTKKIVIEK